MSLRSGVLSALGFCALLLGGPACGTPGDAQAPLSVPREVGPRTWSFDADTVGSAPVGFRFALTGEGREGRWVVRAVANAPSGSHVLAQIDDDATNARYPLAVADEPILKDLRLSVRCRPLSGEVDQAVGLVFRWKGPDDYYVTRANALEDNVRLYHVRNGRRTKIASWDGEVEADRWHTLAVDALADHLVVSWNGVVVIDHHDWTHSGPGRVGLWTKADSVSEFDDLEVAPLER
ncbi:MAG: hypothetical protein ACYTG2_09300 [Planctomycetota bacterium]|jgi:hypothetical protein